MILKKVSLCLTYKMRNCIKSKTFIFFCCSLSSLSLQGKHRRRFPCMCFLCRFFLMPRIRCKMCQQEREMKNAEILAADHSQVIPETQFTFKCHPLVYEIHLSNFLERYILKHLFIYLHLCLALRRERKKWMRKEWRQTHER